jgi:hypothetical protein
MPGRILTIGLVCFLLAAGAAMFFGPLLRNAPDGRLPPCPYTESGDLALLPPGTVAAVGAYEAIRETLARGSIDGIAPQAGVIARVFAADDPKMASLAKRLAAEQDVESARRAFLRLNRLMEKNARRPPRG